ncbi:hypothetical protein ANO11243_034530 [Dothideomycetidae sp. 11243]|nr:hypothetical protein ANO11243_034530 [fungal sp. No.11243]
MATLCIHTFYTFVDDPDKRSAMFDTIQMSACRVVRSLADHIASLSSTSSTLIYDIHGLILSTVLLLRILKSSLPLSSGRDEGTACFHLGLSLLRDTSADKTDVSAKCALRLAELWDDRGVFKNPDGSDCWARKAHSRLIGSPLVDAMLWWQERFDPKRKIMMLDNHADAQRFTPQDAMRTDQPAPEFEINMDWLDFDWTLPDNLEWPQDLAVVPFSDPPALLAFQHTETPNTR